MLDRAATVTYYKELTKELDSARKFAKYANTEKIRLNCEYWAALVTAKRNAVSYILEGFTE